MLFLIDLLCLLHRLIDKGILNTCELDTIGQLAYFPIALLDIKLSFEQFSLPPLERHKIEVCFADSPIPVADFYAEQLHIVEVTQQSLVRRADQILSLVSTDLIVYEGMRFLHTPPLEFQLERLLV